MSATDYPEIDYAYIKRWLGNGDQKEIASKLGFRPDYVSKVLNGKRRNWVIVGAARKKAEQNEAFATAKTEIQKRSTTT